ncbi:MAG TPA: type I-E CRISPR-associated protein Cas6/Cse3/CasE [Terriglobia bacterium]|nr:type I-E CRISPR-associated protein Cas6/Cse3/CasE [Terriglobia bacterium]
MKNGKMYLSCLTIHVGNDPTREQPGRKWLRNIYHVHQRLSMAFPSEARRERDPGFLAPYAAEDFPEHRHLADKKKIEVGAGILRQVHSPRDDEAGFLYRIDPGRQGRAVILVQSATKPDWEYAFHNAQYLLAAPPQVKTYDPSFKAGQRLRFRLIANPTRRLSKNSLGPDGRPVEKGIGKRVPVPADRLLEWLYCRAEKAGFSVDKDSATISPGYLYFKKSRDGDEARLRSVRYDGLLSVTDPACFRETMAQGIGHGKAFGFGLLSVASVARPPWP